MSRGRTEKRRQCGRKEVRGRDQLRKNERWIEEGESDEGKGEGGKKEKKDEGMGTDHGHEEGMKTKQGVEVRT